MIIIKVVHQKLVQATFTSQSSGHLFSTILATRNGKQVGLFARNLVQSTSQNQKVTNANNQQLVPIARNISFRQCRKDYQGGASKANAKVSFSISASSPLSHFSAELDPSILIEQRRLPVETLKQETRDSVERQELAVSKGYYGQSFNETLSTPSERRLVVLMSWLAAKEKHIEKYRQFYLDRGFDVLNVKTSPLDLLLPNVGAKKISKDFVRFMVEKQYPHVVLHGFSVGGYMFGQVLLDIDRQEQKLRKKLLGSIQGLVFDSLVPIEGTCVGVANSITQNKYLAKLFESMLGLYLFLGHEIATKYYLEVSEKVWAGPLKCPTLFLMSKDDKISDHKIVERLEKVWSGLGIETYKKLFDSSPHVQLFQKHHEAYVELVENFLKRIKLNQ